MSMGGSVPRPGIDAQLIEDLKHGGSAARAALAMVFRVLQPRVLAYLKRSGADSATADDLCQDLFVKIMDQIDSFRGQGRFDAWAFSILRRLWLDVLGARAKQIALPEDEDIAPADLHHFQTADRAMQRIAEQRGMSALEAFAVADPAAAHLIELRVIEEWDYDALAIYYDTTPEAMRERISYVRKKVKKYFGPLLDFLKDED